MPTIYGSSPRNKGRLMFAPDTRILIVDDMVSIRELLRASLSALGFKHVTEAEDGLQAYKVLIDRNTPGQQFQLVISDWNMPNLSGLDFLKKVRATPEFAQLPFLLVTSEAERDQVTEAVLAGVSQYVVKPFSTKIMEEKLKGAYAKHKGSRS